MDSSVKSEFGGMEPGDFLTYWRSTFPIQLLFALVIWVTRFLHASQFGLYEDDWTRIPKTVAIGWDGIWKLIQFSFLPDPSQGRPLHPTLVYSMSFLGFKWGDLYSVYLISFVILFTNALLFHSFLKRAFLDDRFAFLGALAFCVYPADTTQTFLTHGLGVQPAIMLLLIGFHCYLAGWKKISYIVILLILFDYETPFLVFAAVPLLRPRLKWELRKHLAVMVGLLAVAVSYRSLTAESRVAHMGVRELFLGSTNLLTGPLTCLGMYFYHPLEALTKISRPDAWVMVVSLLVLAPFFAARFGRAVYVGLSSSRAQSVFALSAPMDGRKILLVGFAMLLLAYPLTMTTTGISIAGRGTRVHIASIVGGSILFAWLCSYLLSSTTSRRGRYAVALGVSSFFSLLIGFGLTVQHDYALGWQEQRGFWTDLVNLCPSLQDGDVILVEPSGLRDTRQLLFLRKDLNGVPDTRQIKSLDNVYHGLDSIYQFPKEWKLPPAVFRLPKNWEKNLFTADGQISLLTIEAGYFYDPASRGPVSPSHVIFLDTSQGHLSRRSFLVNTRDGKTLILKQDTSVTGTMPHTAFAPYLLYPGGHSLTPYLAK